MISKGREALFFIIGLLVMLGAVWVLRPTASAPPNLWIFYARATGTQEMLWGRRYTAAGRPRGTPLKLGPLGLTQETEVAGAGEGAVWVTTGPMVFGIREGRVWRRYPAPSGAQVLSLAVFSGRLYGVVESRQARRVSVMAWRHRWRTVKSGMPLGITTLVAGPHHSVWALTAEPHKARLTEVAGGQRAYGTASLEPQGTAGFAGNQPIIPYARGASQFGYWSRRAHAFASVYQAAISVTNTQPLWGLGVRGMIPFASGRFRFGRTVPWPSPQATTLVVIGQGHPWIAVLDGFSQGRWFNVETGQFGPGFQIKTPWWAVVRAASLGS